MLNCKMRRIKMNINIYKALIKAAKYLFALMSDVSLLLLDLYFGVLFLHKELPENFTHLEKRIDKIQVYSLMYLGMIIINFSAWAGSILFYYIYTNG